MEIEELKSLLREAHSRNDRKTAEALLVKIESMQQNPKREFTPPIDVEANRNQAVGEFIEGLPVYERIGIGVREPIAQAATRINNALGIGGEGSVFGNPQEVERGLAYSRQANDVATGVGRAIPAVAALSRVPMGVVPSAVAGGAYGAATSEDPTSGALAGAAGGAAGSVAAGLVGRAAQGVAGNWANRAVQGSDDIVQTLDDFQRLGGKLTPGQATGGRSAQFIDEALANNPITATPYGAIERNNQVVLNRTVQRALGVTSSKTDEIGPSALKAADDVISREFNAVARQIPEVELPVGAADDITDILSSRTVRPFLEKLQAGRITGRDYMDIRSKLLDITRRQGSDKVDDAWELIETLDDAAEAIAPEGYKAAYAAARERFKTLLAIDKYRRGIQGGNANALTLESAIRSVFRKQYTRGAPTLLPETSDLFTAVRAMSDPRMTALTGGSPTARRLMPSVAGLALGAGAYYVNPAAAAGMAGGAILGSRGYLAAPAAPVVRQIGGAAGSAAALESQR